MRLLQSRYCCKQEAIYRLHNQKQRRYFRRLLFKRRRDAPGKQRLTGPQKMKQRLNRETIDAIFNRNIRAVLVNGKADDGPGMDTGFFERRRFAYYGNMFGDGAAVVRLRGQSVMTKRTARFC